MPLGKERTLTPDEVYSLTAFLLYINDVIPEDQVLDQQSLPKVKMPIGDDYAPLPEWKPKTRRLQGLPLLDTTADRRLAPANGNVSVGDATLPASIDSYLLPPRPRWSASS